MSDSHDFTTFDEEVDFFIPRPLVWLNVSDGSVSIM